MSHRLMLHAGKQGHDLAQDLGLGLAAETTAARQSAQSTWVFVQQWRREILNVYKCRTGCDSRSVLPAVLGTNLDGSGTSTCFQAKHCLRKHAHWMGDFLKQLRTAYERHVHTGQQGFEGLEHGLLGVTCNESYRKTIFLG